LKVVWKVAGKPAPVTQLTCTNLTDFSSPAVSPATNKPSDARGTGVISITVSHPVVGGGDGPGDDAIIAANDATPAHYRQEFDLSKLSFYKDTLPKSAGNNFTLQIGGRVLSADNVTDVNDLVTKLKQDSDYNFVRTSVGLDGTNLQLFDIEDLAPGSKTDAGVAVTSRTQLLRVNFGEHSTDRAFLRQSSNNTTIADPESAVTALDYVDQAAKVVNEARARMGATMSRIEYTINNLMNVSQNTEEAKSRVLDTDYAKESAELAKSQILAQAGTAMLAQANQSQQYVLNLIKP